MELRPGYTMTELGVLPEDWYISTITSFTECTAGGTPSTKNPSYWGGKHPWMNSGELHLKRIYNVSGRITDNGIANSSTKYIPKESVLIGLAGQGKTRGTVAIAKIELCTNQSIAAIFPSKSCFADYLFYNLDSRYTELRELSSGDGGRGGLNLKLIGNLLVPIPPLPEQHAIAAALSDVDALLDAQERLIAKKRNIKLAAMQQLLTGKTRLPGFQQNGKYKQTELGLFPEDWCHTELNMIIANIIGGGTPRRANPQFWNGNIPWVTVKDFATFSPYRTQEYITKEGIRSSATHLIPAGTLLIATRMALGKSAIYAVDVAINQDLKALFFKDYIDTKFIFYWFLWQESNIQALGSGSTVKGISLNLLKKINICCPPSLDEQRAIAAVLSDMDAELAALEARRDKLRAVKQGMMRELLTGRTRLAGAGGRHGQ